MGCRVGAPSARTGTALAVHLVIIFIFGTASAGDSKKIEDRRVIVTYSSRARRSAQGHWETMLLSQGVTMVQDLVADNLAVISGPADSVMAEALKLPGVENVEEDIMMTAHVGF
jgi:hypothetical protein